MRSQALAFSPYWVTPPSQQYFDEIKTCALPLMVTKLVHEVKDGESLGRFLQDADTREKFKAEIAQLIEEFEKKLQTLWKPKDKEIIEIEEQLQMLKKKFDYAGINSATNNQYVTAYREGVPLFFNILIIY